MIKPPAGNKDLRTLNSPFHYCRMQCFRRSYLCWSRLALSQTYEITFELAWKTLKDFLESKEVVAQFPRDVIKEAFKNKIIREGETWLDMLEKRNLMSHTYDETTAGLALK